MPRFEDTEWFDKLTLQQKEIWNQNRRAGSDYIDSVIWRALTGEIDGKEGLQEDDVPLGV